MRTASRRRSNSPGAISSPQVAQHCAKPDTVGTGNWHSHHTTSLRASTPMRVPPRRFPILGATILLLVVALLAAGCGSGVSASQVAKSAGADSCTNSGFGMQSKLTGDKQTIFNCTMPSGAVKCVTYQGGIASDSTEVVKLLFANTLGSQKPDCLSG